MLNKIKNLIVAAAAAIAIPLMFAQPTFAAAGTCPSGSIRSGETVSDLSKCNVKDDDSLIPTLQTIINVVLGVLGLVAVMMIILGGFNYMTSQGEPSKTAKARNTILYGVVGLLIALLAFAIVNFVLTSVFT